VGVDEFAQRYLAQSALLSGASRPYDDLLQAGEAELVASGHAEVAMDGYGYRWLRVVPPDGRWLA
jgi:hypothetical protein